MLNSANNENNKNRKGNYKNPGKKEKLHAIDNSNFPATKKETIFQLEPGHQRSSPPDSETKIRQEPQVDQVINING